MKTITCIRCGKRRKVHAWNMCTTCYQKDWKEKGGEALRAHRAQLQRERKHKLSPEERTEAYRKAKASGGAHLRKLHASYEKNRRLKLGDQYRQKERDRNKRRREQRLAYNHAYYQKHKEELKSYQSEFRKTHPEWVAEVKRRRRSRAAGLAATLTESEWQSILEKYGHRCVYCKRNDVALVREHKIPVVRGGHYTADNIVPACQSCNSRKHDLTHDEFLKKIGAER